MSNFRLNCKNVALTYPRCDVMPETMGQFLSTVWDCKYLLVAQEEHKEESELGPGTHLHCLLLGARKKNIKRADYFDFEGFHPNVQGCRDVQKWFEYCMKEGGLKWEDGDRALVSPDELLNQALTCTSEGALLRFLIAKNMKSHWQMYRRLWQLNRAEVDEAPVRDISEFDVPIQVSEWMANHDNRSLILVGVAGTGKTSLARSVANQLGSVFWCPQRESLAAFGGENTIIFDDTDFGGCSRTTLLNYVDVEQTRCFRVLYGSITVAAGVRRIFTTNSLDFLLGEHQRRPEIERRIRVVHVSGSLRSVGQGLGSVQEAETAGGRTSPCPEETKAEEERGTTSVSTCLISSEQRRSGGRV